MRHGDIIPAWTAGAKWDKDRAMTRRRKKRSYPDHRTELEETVVYIIKESATRPASYQDVPLKAMTRRGVSFRMNMEGHTSMMIVSLESMRVVIPVGVCSVRSVQAYFDKSIRP
jgi:hypothetical protein